MISDFLDAIIVAQANRQEWIETSQEVINHYNRRGLGNAKYFIYQGIKVCEYGKLDEILEEQSRQHDQVVFGPQEGTVQGL